MSSRVYFELLFAYVKEDDKGTAENDNVVAVEGTTREGEATHPAGHGSHLSNIRIRIQAVLSEQ
jgi:hypothetical protein